MDNRIENLTNTLALLTQLYKTYLPQTNNQLKTSSNLRNQAIIQDDRVVIQNVQGRQNRGQGNNARDAGAAGYEGAQNKVEYANPGGQDNTVDEDVDEEPVQDLALNVDNVFQADDCVAFDSDVDEAPMAQIMFMANLSSAYPVFDKAGPSYDLDILSEVHDHDHYQDAVCEHHEVHKMHDDVQPNYVVDSHTIDTSNSNMILNNMEVHLDYLKHLKESVETIHEIVEEAKIERPSDRSLASACLYTKHSQKLLEYVIGTCRINRPVVFGLRLRKHMTEDRSRLKNFIKKFIRIVRFENDHFGAIMGYGDYMIVEDMMKSSSICLLSKASKTKSWLWHCRLNHLNFGTINDLARKDLVRGLPRLKFEKDHICYACQLGKSKKHTHSPKTKTTNLEVLNTLHMDFCRLMRVQIISGKKYVLVIVDDYMWFTWVKFLRSKDETPEVVIKFLEHTKVVATSCYTQNRSLIHTHHNKTPYELVHNKKPDFTFLRVFGALFYPTNDSEDLGKLHLAADIRVFVGYAPSRKGY
nr:integrase, catalytic region, zinc finger, CCHC-type, peptidase aspartic, catalytic [Tanacetum cinerariifolium]